MGGGGRGDLARARDGGRRRRRRHRKLLGRHLFNKKKWLNARMQSGDDETLHFSFFYYLFSLFFSSFEEKKDKSNLGDAGATAGRRAALVALHPVLVHKALGAAAALPQLVSRVRPHVRLATWTVSQPLNIKKIHRSSFFSFFLLLCV
jgi:hypothetical protein